MNSPRSGGRTGSLWSRIRGELLDEPRTGDGTPTLLIGLAFGLVWFFLIYVLPGRSWWDTKILVMAICFVLWGVADILPRGQLFMSALLRAVVFVFLLAFGAWILLDLLAVF